MAEIQNGRQEGENSIYSNVGKYGVQSYWFCHSKPLFRKILLINGVFVVQNGWNSKWPPKGEISIYSNVGK